MPSLKGDDTLCKHSGTAAFLRPEHPNRARSWAFNLLGVVLNLQRNMQVCLYVDLHHLRGLTTITYI